MEHDEVIYYLTRSLMETNDTRSDEFAAHVLEATQSMLTDSNDLYIGTSFPGVLSLPDDEVRRAHWQRQCNLKLNHVPS